MNKTTKKNSFHKKHKIKSGGNRRTSRRMSNIGADSTITTEMYRGCLEFIELNKNKLKNKNSSLSIQDLEIYSKVWLYKTYYHCSYSPAIEKKFKTFVLPKISINH
jgi:hypothetical protein